MELNKYNKIIQDRLIRCVRMGHLPVYESYNLNAESRLDDRVRGRCRSCFKIVYRPLNRNEINKILDRDRGDRFSE